MHGTKEDFILESVGNTLLREATIFIWLTQRTVRSISPSLHLANNKQLAMLVAANEAMAVKEEEKSSESQ
jgi:hypothetical protein